MATAKLYPDALKTLNKWFDQGHLICFFTARIEAHREVTEKWLKDNGFKYHSLLMGKPRGGNYHWIDNHLVKATRYNGKFTDLIEKEVTIEVFDDGQSHSKNENRSPTLAELKEKNKKAEIVFWVGCAGSFDERAKKITKAFAKILIDSKISLLS